MTTRPLLTFLRSLTTSTTSSSISPYLYGFSHRWVREPVSSSPNDPQANNFTLLTWNIDFMKRGITERWKAALDYIQDLRPTPDIILFQETDTKAFPVLLAHDFVRQRYLLSNVAGPEDSRYSTLILVARQFASQTNNLSTTRVPYGELTRMWRDVLYVDFEAGTNQYRVATTHLESLTGFGTTARPQQLQIAAQLLTSEGIAGGLVAGDMNCIEDSDKGVPEKIGLVDAWKMVKGEEDGHTWGYQPPSRFPPKRMDKILTTNQLEVVDIQRVGIGLETTVSDEKVWVSDHYGLLAKIVLR